jgi:hypothetical protein
VRAARLRTVGKRVSGSSSVFIGDFRIPDEVVAAIAADEWKLPLDDFAIRDIFTEFPSPSGRLYQPSASRPRVLYLPSHASGWIEVAANAVIFRSKFTGPNRLSNDVIKVP